MEVKWQLQSRPPLSTDCRSLSQISLFDCERNSILGHSYQSWQSGIRNSAAAAGLRWSAAHHRAITRGKTEAGETPSFAAFVPFKDRYTGKIRHFERVPIQEKSHALPQTRMTFQIMSGTYCPSMLRKYIWPRSIMPGMSTRIRKSEEATRAGKRRRTRLPGRR